jgi:hypothetical protein
MVNVSIVSLHCVKHDAISNVMKTYSDWIRSEPGYHVKSYGYHSEYFQEELPFQKIEQNADLLLDAHFQNSHIPIWNLLPTDGFGWLGTCSCQGDNDIS